MNRQKWEGINSSAKLTARIAKNSKNVLEFLGDYPEEGYMRDNISKNKVLIVECKSSSLRRYQKLLDNFLKLVSEPVSKKKILDKKIEMEKELNGREDK